MQKVRPHIRRKVAHSTPTGKNRTVFVNGNSKLGNNTLTFNISPLVTCTPTKFCKDYCYALKGHHVFQTVIDANADRLELSKHSDFVELANAELRKSRCIHVRIHSAGDFYDEAYIDKWIAIVRANPSVRFLAYTRRTDLKSKLLELAQLPNMSLFESLDNSRPLPSIGVKTAHAGEIQPPNTFKCPGNCPKCNFVCWTTNKNIFFPLH